MVTGEVGGERVSDQPQRRKFTPEYKLRILQEIDSRKDEGHGVVGEILRREGLYASQVASWRNTLEEVIARGLPERKRGRKKDPALAYKQENEKLQRQVLRLKEDLRLARLILEAQKKIAEMYPGSSQHDENTESGV
jgi:transposase-like protein